MAEEQVLIDELPTMDEETRWQAVAAREAAFDRVFFYGVHSTGIYCKPSCPSRRPRRTQVVFFDSTEQAEAARFRPCRRCRPAHGPKRDAQAEMVERACRLIEASATGAPSLAELGARLGVSRYYLQRTFKKLLGVSPRQYALAQRVSQFKTRIREGESVTGAMYEAGYGSSSRLYEQADAELGMTPASYSRGGAGAQIKYAVAACELGPILVAATERGLCAVRLGDTGAQLVATLRAEFPSAEISEDRLALGLYVEALLRHLAGQQTTLDLPLDVRATAFQRRVWEELRRIPYGSTRSYSEIARATGQPQATRAVARACASNPLAIVTPCHRVIREDGHLGGYRWGMERKRKLLAKEQERKSRAPVEEIYSKE
ncbi:MAG TPA: bifunctional DNA-binding transcriptional regulator/O6-methylguanine-DNA methyltransferase Ada [Pyrinomonadaceae bacterium]|jgi:AraC family transcriptional regulator of adaptative response/methylated-DNA-[protein]-cysteine methyltransferase